MQSLGFLCVAVSIGVCLLLVPTHLLGQDVDCNGSVQKTHISALNHSGLSGTATLCLGDDGASARLRVEGVTPGHAYTAWFFYYEGVSFVVARFDSALAGQSKLTLSARVGGLAAAIGSQIQLVVVDHGDVSSLTPFVRAQNVLTPAGKPFSAIAVFNP
jgi:hypothetical protein